MKYRILYLPEAYFIVAGNTAISDLTPKIYNSIEEAQTIITENRINIIKHPITGNNIYFESILDSKAFKGKKHLFEIIEFTDEI